MCILEDKAALNLQSDTKPNAKIYIPFKHRYLRDRRTLTIKIIKDNFCSIKYGLYLRYTYFISKSAYNKEL